MHSDHTHNPTRYSSSDLSPDIRNPTDKGQQGVSNGGGRCEEVLGEFVLRPISSRNNSRCGKEGVGELEAHALAPFPHKHLLIISPVSFMLYVQLC